MSASLAYAPFEAQRAISNRTLKTQNLLFFIIQMGAKYAKEASPKPAHFLGKTPHLLLFLRHQPLPCNARNTRKAWHQFPTCFLITAQICWVHFSKVAWSLPSTRSRA